MAAACPPSPHVNVFGVHTEYGPHDTPRPLRVQLLQVAGSTAGFLVGVAGLAYARVRRR